MLRFRSYASLSAMTALLFLTNIACDDDKDDPAPTVEPTSSPAPTADPTASITLKESIAIPNNSFPEDIVTFEQYAFVSNWITGGIKRIDLSDSSVDDDWVTNSNTSLTAWWALDVDTQNEKLFSLQEPPYGFDPTNIPTQKAQVVAYNIDTAAAEKTWELPQGKIFNSMKYDGSRYLYLNAVTLDAEIWRIDTQSDAAATKWADGAVFNATTFGHGGLAIVTLGSNKAVYTVCSGKIWKLAINSDGSSGTPTAVTLKNADGTDYAYPTFADGMTSTGKDLYFAYNDADPQTTPNDVGVVFRVELAADGNTGTISQVVTGLGDPSGVTIFKGAKDYLLINESRFGLLLANNFNPTTAIEGIVAKGGLRIVTKDISDHDHD